MKLPEKQIRARHFFQPRQRISREIFSQCKKLAGSHFSSIYITRDLTYRQRSELRARRVAAGGVSGTAQAFSAPQGSSTVAASMSVTSPAEASSAGVPQQVSGSVNGSSVVASASAGVATPRSSTPSPSLFPSGHTPGGSVRDRIASLQLGK